MSPKALEDLDRLSPASLDKPRSKLGYQRTTIACVFCRKRKIRCVRDPNDLAARCMTCIRLKKDCQFLPVDNVTEREKSAQAQPSDAQPQGARPSRSPAGAASAIVQGPNRSTAESKPFTVPSNAPKEPRTMSEPSSAASETVPPTRVESLPRLQPHTIPQQGQWQQRSYSVPQPAYYTSYVQAPWPYQDSSPIDPAIYSHGTNSNLTSPIDYHDATLQAPHGHVPVRATSYSNDIIRPAEHYQQQIFAPVPSSTGAVSQNVYQHGQISEHIPVHTQYPLMPAQYATTRVEAPIAYTSAEQWPPTSTPYSGYPRHDSAYHSAWQMAQVPEGGRGAYYPYSRPISGAGMDKPGHSPH